MLQTRNVYTFRVLFFKFYCEKINIITLKSRQSFIVRSFQEQPVNNSEIPSLIDNLKNTPPSCNVAKSSRLCHEMGGRGEPVGLTGSYSHRLDAKGRVVLPAKFREELGGLVVAAIGIERCVTLYSPDRWEALLEKLQQLPSGNSKARDLRRIILASAHELEIDGMGRILMPNVLRTYGSINQEVTINGNGDRIEIWDQTAWDQYQSAVLQDLRETAEGVEGI